MFTIAMLLYNNNVKYYNMIYIEKNYLYKKSYFLIYLYLFFKYFMKRKQKKTLCFILYFSFLLISYFIN